MFVYYSETDLSWRLEFKLWMVPYEISIGQILSTKRILSWKYVN